MAIIIETCPKCGHDLQDLILAAYPPIPQKKCFNCGWEWTGVPEEVVKVPFGGNSLIMDDLVGITNNQLQINDNNLNKYNLNDTTIGNFKQSACENCSNNPKNGGSGICHCTLGRMQITY